MEKKKEIGLKIIEIQLQFMEVPKPAGYQKSEIIIQLFDNTIFPLKRFPKYFLQKVHQN